jgi:predicted GNAT superfamily acetyltransferase
VAGASAAGRRLSPSAVTALTEPWALAHRKAADAGVSLQPLTTVEDADLVNEVIRATWGGQHMDREVVRALALSGNVSWGAVDGSGTLIGFVLGWAGVDDDGLHVHSHMLASLPDHRHKGVGEALKLAQRAQALDQGIDVVRWTFDPMIARNAWLNLGKLGAVIDRFARNFYGDMADSLNEGERSDRLTVAWHLRREPGPHEVTEPAVELLVRVDGELPAPAVSGSRPDRAALIELPVDYHEIRTADPVLATVWRDAIADAVEACLDAKMVGAAFDRSRSAYVFAVPDAIEGGV